MRQIGNGRQQVVIIGAGFGGIFAARSLRSARADITVIDRHNYHLFQPLLYQVATAGLAPSDIAWPVRSMLNRQRNAAVLLDEVSDVDLQAQEVVMDDRRVPYDDLVLATGATHSYFGHADWATAAPGLKTVDDATYMRRRLLMAFERAEIAEDETTRRRLLQFVVVGGGPTGVELAGAIAELAHHTLARDFRVIDPRSARVVLLEAGPRILPMFSETLSRYAQQSLQRLGVEVRVDSAVTNCDRAGVTIGNDRLDAGTVIWAAGVTASAAGQWLGTETDDVGRVIVDTDLSVPGHPNVFVIGDAARVESLDGELVPGVAPAAKQEGRYVAKLILARLEGRKAPDSFRYLHAGMFATIGRSSAVIECRRLRLRGLIAWWLWGIAHIYFLVGLRSPVMVTLHWLWQYLTYGRGARLITGGADADSGPD